MIIYNIDPNNYNGVPKWAKIVAIICGIMLVLNLVVGLLIVFSNLVL